MKGRLCMGVLWKEKLVGRIWISFSPYFARHGVINIGRKYVIFNHHNIIWVFPSVCLLCHLLTDCNQTWQENAIFPSVCAAEIQAGNPIGWLLLILMQLDRLQIQWKFWGFQPLCYILYCKCDIRLDFPTAIKHRTMIWILNLTHKNDWVWCLAVEVN